MLSVLCRATVVFTQLPRTVGSGDFFPRPFNHMLAVHNIGGICIDFIRHPDDFTHLFGIERPCIGRLKRLVYRCGC